MVLLLIWGEERVRIEIEVAVQRGKELLAFPLVVVEGQ